MKTCNTITIFLPSVTFNIFLTILCSCYALFHLPQTYHVTLQLLYVLMVVFKIHSSMVFTPVTFFTFKYHLRIHLHCSNINCGSTILFYTGYCHLAKCTSTKCHALLSTFNTNMTSKYYHSVSIFYMYY
jgi:hypothetical protein